MWRAKEAAVNKADITSVAIEFSLWWRGLKKSVYEQLLKL